MTSAISTASPGNISGWLPQLALATWMSLERSGRRAPFDEEWPGDPGSPPGRSSC